MISFLRGTVIEKRKQSITIETNGGVGYEVHLTAAQALGYALGQEVSFFTYLKVSDSALELYGFDSVEGREFFTLLLTVSGIGPKTAMNILALGSTDKIQSAIARGDVKYLTGVSGLGKKTAERLVVELKGKFGKLEAGSWNLELSDVLGEVAEALVGMGYSQEEAKDAVQAVDCTGKTTEDALRLALKALKRN